MHENKTDYHNGFQFILCQSGHWLIGLSTAHQIIKALCNNLLVAEKTEHDSSLKLRPAN